MVDNNKIINEFIKLTKQIKFDIDKSKNKKEELSNSFRLLTIQKIIKILEKFPDKIVNSDQLKNLPGIGKGTIDRINEILKTGKLSEIKQDVIDKSYLKYLEELEDVYGIGHKTALELFNKYNVKSISDLKKLYKTGIIELPPNIVKGLEYYGKIKENIPRIEIDKINNYLLDILRSLDKELFGIICGSYRRLKLTSNDIDMLIVHPKLKTKKDVEKCKINYLKLFIEELIDKKFIVDSLTDINVPTKYMGLSKFENNPIRRIDIRFIPYESYYYAMLYFTGAKDFNKKMRMVAINLGYTLNEYGLFDKKNKMLKVKSEKEIFDLLGMEYIDPQYRN
jgi:DNA polymerase/3'-5' exonuclease PolX